MRLSKLLLFVGLSLTAGFIWGYALVLQVIYQDIAQHYLNPQIPMPNEATQEVLLRHPEETLPRNSTFGIGQYDEMASVDVIRNGDDIWIVEHYTGRLVFEYNRFKEEDKTAFKEYEDLLKECAARNWPATRTFNQFLGGTR